MTAEVLDELEIVLSIIQQHDKTVKVKLLTILTKILSNILKDPENEKFRKVRLANPNINSAVVVVDGGMELMGSCGFDVTTMPAADGSEETEEFFFFGLEEPLDAPQNRRKISKINVINTRLNNLINAINEN